MRNVPLALVERAACLAALWTDVVAYSAMLTNVSMLEGASTFPVTMNAGPSSRILFYGPCYALATMRHGGLSCLRAIGCARRDVHTHRLPLAVHGADERLGLRSKRTGTRLGLGLNCV